MPSARQVAAGLAKRGVKGQAAVAVSRLLMAVENAKTPEEAAQALKGAKPADLFIVHAVIRDILAVVTEIEKTHVPSRQLSGVPRKEEPAA